MRDHSDDLESNGDIATSSTIAIVDDDPLVRNSISQLLRARGYITRLFASGADFMIWIRPDTQAVVVTDIRMPGMDGMNLISAMHEAQCLQPIVVMTGHADVPLAVKAMKAGAAEFLEKPFAMETLVASIRRCGTALEQMTRSIAEKSVIARLIATLSPREAQVLDGLVDGCSNKVIAAKLDISPRTVEIHRANVMTKLGVSSVSDVVKMVLKAQPR